MVERIRTLLESRQLTPTQFADLIGVARPIVSHILSGRNKPSLEVVQRILAAMPELAMPWLLNGSGPMLAVADANAGKVAPTATAPAPMPAPSAEAPASEQVYPLQTLANQASKGGLVEAEAPIPSANTLKGRRTPPVAERPGLVSKPAVFKPAAPLKRFVAKANTGGIPGEIRDLEASKLLALAPEQNAASTGPAVAPSASPSMPAVSTSAANAPIPAPSVPLPSGASENAVAEAFLAGAEKPIRRIVIFYRDGSFADYQPE